MSVFDPSLERNPIRPVVRDEREMAMLRHDIRGALAGVVGGVRHLARAEIDQEVWPQVERIVASANALEWLIAQAFGDARTSDGPPETDADRLIAHLRHRFAGAAGETGVAFRVEMDPGLPSRLRLEPVSLTRVLENLVAAALESVPGGTVAFAAGMRTGRDRLSSNQRSERRSGRPGPRPRPSRRRDRRAGRPDARRPPRRPAGADRRDRRANPGDPPLRGLDRRGVAVPRGRSAAFGRAHPARRGQSDQPDGRVEHAARARRRGAGLQRRGRGARAVRRLSGRPRRRRHRDAAPDRAGRHPGDPVAHRRQGARADRRADRLRHARASRPHRGGGRQRADPEADHQHRGVGARARGPRPLTGRGGLAGERGRAARTTPRFR